MRLDSADRSFFGIVAGAFVAYLALGVGACVLLAMYAYRLTAGGGTLERDELVWLIPVLLFLLPVAAGAVAGAWTVTRQVVSSSRLSRRVRRLTPMTSERVDQAAEKVGLGRRVRLIDVDEPFSFAYGAFAPRVVVSRGLVDRATEDELIAVLEHERYHVCSLDPLRLIVARAITSSFFYLPALRDLRTRYVAARELAADRCAIRLHGRTPLAGALLKVAAGPDWAEFQTAAAIGAPDLLDVRIAQLEAGDEPPLARISGAAWGLSALAAGVLGVGLAVAVVAVGGLRAALRTMTPGATLDVGHLLGGFACAVAVAAAASSGWWWLAYRARRPLDTTSR